MWLQYQAVMLGNTVRWYLDWRKEDNWHSPYQNKAQRKHATGLQEYWQKSSWITKQRKKINYTKIKQRLWLCWYLLYFGFLKFIPELGGNHLTKIMLPTNADQVHVPEDEQWEGNICCNMTNSPLNKTHSDYSITGILNP